MENLQEKVIECLKHYPHTRNNDAQFTFCVIWKYYPTEVKIIDEEWFISTKALKIVREDGVKRIRAKLNEQGLYLPDDPNVRRQRKIKEQEWLKFLGYEGNKI